MNTPPRLDLSMRERNRMVVRSVADRALLALGELTDLATLYNVPETLDDLQEAQALVRFATNAIREQLA